MFGGDTGMDAHRCWLFPHLSSSSPGGVYLFPFHENLLARRSYSAYLALLVAVCLEVVGSHANTCRTKEGLVPHQLLLAV